MQIAEINEEERGKEAAKPRTVGWAGLETQGGEHK